MSAAARAPAPRPEILPPCFLRRQAPAPKRRRAAGGAKAKAAAAAEGKRGILKRRTRALIVDEVTDMPNRLYASWCGC